MCYAFIPGTAIGAFLERRNTGRNAFVADAIAPAAMRERRENGKTPASHRRKRFF